MKKLSLTKVLIFSVSLMCFFFVSPSFAVNSVYSNESNATATDKIVMNARVGEDPEGLRGVGSADGYIDAYMNVQTLDITFIKWTGNTTIQLFDDYGHVYYSKTINVTNSITEIINISNLKPDVYTLYIKGENGNYAEGEFRKR